MIKLEVHLCDQRRSITVAFTTEVQAAMYVEANSHRFAFAEVNGHPLNLTLYPALAEALDPTCEHGMSAQLCSGPNHFGEPGDIGWD